VACVLGAVTLFAGTAQPRSAIEERGEAEARLEGTRIEIERLERELDRLAGQERGVLGELERVGTELRLRQAEFDGVTTELDEVNLELETRESEAAELQGEKERSEAYLAFRLRRLYRAGPGQALRRFVGGQGAQHYWSGVRYASLLNARDARMLDRYRETSRKLDHEREVLGQKQAELASLQEELAASRSRLDAARAGQRRALAEIRQDQDKRRAAVDELREAAEALSHLVTSFDASGEAPGPDMMKFRGLLDWPARGQVSAGFGTVIHPRFRTRVPHPGWDIDAPVGSEIRSVFDGQVAFAAWMRGYGLTAIVDHGGGLLSIYAHSAALLVEAGENVRRGQVLGTIGETGSLRGPFLYFELRLDGQPVDPREWLRQRPAD